MSAASIEHDLQALQPQQPSLKRPAEAVHDHGYQQLSNKARKTNSTRTGQACDRCKVRKIRCDARPGGCSPCLQNNTECKTTDRITGRTTSRGHTESVETENVGLKMYVMELQAQLKGHGIEPSAPPPVASSSYPPSTPVYGGGQWDEQQPAPVRQQTNGYQAQSSHDRQTSSGSLLPEFRSECIGDNYLGVASENDWLSPIEGTSLALFGTKIDLADFMPPEPNRDAVATSYQTFVSYAFGGKRLAQIPVLPDYPQCRQYAEWYFRTIQVFIPVLHKPDMMSLLARIYEQGHSATPAETVMVHMMLAIMYFQYSARNSSEETRQMSYEHYHYALTFVPQLMTSHRLEDIQALALICSQLRCQPRPGANWMFTNLVFALAIESGLHRSAKAWPSSAATIDAHTAEMRKRVFWTILLFNVNASGNFGRPMPLRFDDFDIEIPEPIPDCLPGEELSLRPFKRCSFRSAIEGFKLLKILIKVYSTIYAVNPNPDGSYDTTVRQLAKDIQSFESQIPPELSMGPQTLDEDRTSGLYLQLCAALYQILLHHPALCRTDASEVYNRNLDVCLEASNKMMLAASQLKELKSLDTTLYYTTGFLAAICTTVFAHTERKSRLSSADVQRLRSDMDTWLDILGPVGQMLGTGLQLQSFMSSIIDRHLNDINRHIAAETASAAVHQVSAGASNGVSSISPAEPPAQNDYVQPAKYEAPPSDYYSAPFNSYQQAAPSALTPAQSTPQQSQVPLLTPTPSVDPAAWRHFADNLMTGLPTSNSNGFMTSMPSTGMGGAVHGQAAFGGMAMPDTSQAWPYVLNSSMP